MRPPVPAGGFNQNLAMSPFDHRPRVAAERRERMDLRKQCESLLPIRPPMQLHSEVNKANDSAKPQPCGDQVRAIVEPMQEPDGSLASSGVTAPSEREKSRCETGGDDHLAEFGGPDCDKKA